MAMRLAIAIVTSERRDGTCRYALRLCIIMDIDDDYTQPVSTSPSTSRIFAPIDDAHPFDLDAYISNYSGAHPAIHPTFVRLRIVLDS